MTASLDVKLFASRIKRFYEQWESPQSNFSDVDAFLVLNGKSEDIYGKTISTQTYFFGYELQETAMLIAKKGITILSSRKKVEFLKPLNSSGVENLTFTLLTRSQDDADKANVALLAKDFLSSGNGDKLGVFSKEIERNSESEFSKSVASTLKSKAKEVVDSSLMFSQFFAAKEEVEVQYLRKASEVTCILFSKHLKEKIMDVIDDDKKVSHQSLSDGCQEALKNRDLTRGYEQEFLEICYDPIIQSGGSYNLKFSAENDKKPMHFGTIICSLGVRYRSYCSNVVRTLIVNPNAKQSTYYEYLHNLLDWAIEQMKPGVVFSNFYNTIVNKVKVDHPELVDKLIRTFGFVTGIEFRDGNYVIGPKSSAVFREGMSININLGFQDLLNEEAESEKDKHYALWLGDIVILGLGENRTNQVLTAAAKRRPRAVSLYIEEDEEEEEAEGAEDENVDGEGTDAKRRKKEVSGASKDGSRPGFGGGGGLENGDVDGGPEALGRGHRRAILDQKTRSEQTAEEKRLQQRRELFQQLQVSARNRLSGLKADGETGQKAKSNVAYKGAGQMPKEDDVRKLRIFVDKKYETVILPIFGHPTPFHISTIKNVSSSIEADYTYLRINFHHPGAVVGPKDASNFQNPQATFLKEMTYRASNQRHHGETTSPSTNLNNAYRIIKEVLKKFRSREAEEKERANLVEQDNLVIEPGKTAFRLRDLYIRPNIVAKRITGTLEAHSNGFRFTSIRGDKVDILYNNIKHAFYQPCDGEMIILLHFNLKNAIMYGKKKQDNIQFYTEVGELTTDLGKSHSRMYDRDDLEAEQREREMREQIKTAFKTFVERVENLAKRYNLEFEVPFRDLGFYGCPLRTTVFMMPTSSCLVSLSEWPPFVITLEEVELVMFERVSLSIKTFDMIFVFKDYRIKPAMITSIPSNSLDHVKEWILSCDIYYAEGVRSMNWPKLMKTIIDDPEDFLEQNGWAFISPDDDDDEDEDGFDSDADDESYQPSMDSDAEDDEGGGGGDEDGDGSGSEYNDDDDDDEEEDWDAEEESSAEGSLDSDESEGKDWEELEREAIREDRKREHDDAVRAKKRHRSPSPRPAKKAKHHHQRR
ncbi:FACT complex subunit [Echinococcus granulosus]|uniref:FACT complex subunit n=1 Tax=Echinococcus granulosus TaxID=6210 RepID=U6JBG8_ECHGR|nr:FACT complex subunit [Echinococcus granulosus]EUB56131.1 FACT complex subunit [Echinococcus granulosus]CDS20690.1 FACT complex subunit SPT16 [Echinococcus granulosus]